MRLSFSGVGFGGWGFLVLTFFCAAKKIKNSSARSAHWGFRKGSEERALPFAKRGIDEVKKYLWYSSIVTHHDRLLFLLTITD